VIIPLLVNVLINPSELKGIEWGTRLATLIKVSKAKHPPRSYSFTITITNKSEVSDGISISTI
jgi:hypothetical protein